MITKRQESPEIQGFYKDNFVKIDVKNKLITVPDGVKSVTTVMEILRW
ncbi:MAG: hypothetical protein VB119_12530 [Candidatus Metalachnospira sp.]|nr:hypothetical protein [Candidatus Metalachnospira sp.]